MRGEAFLRRVGVVHPIIQGPMAGGFSTAELAAAVSAAGGLGSIGAAYQSPEQIVDTGRKIRAQTDKPFSINLFAGGYETIHEVDAAPMLAVMAEAHARLGLPEPALPPQPPDPFPAQLEAILEVRPALFSFTFGLPEKAVLDRVRERGILIAGTATTVEEGRRLAAAGVDAIIAQGGEAGGHRGTFAGRFEDSMVPTLELVASIAGAVPTPVLAAGGLMDGGDAARAIRAGATAAIFGTAFLVCPEAGTPEAHKRALLSARGDTTVITRAFSGRPARGLRNDFIAACEEREGAILPFPLQNALTRPMRTMAAKAGEAGYLSLWAGQGMARVRAMPAAALVAVLARELEAALAIAKEGR